MKSKNKRAVILVILLGTISFWLIIHNKKSTIKEELRDFAVQDTATVTKIFLADKMNNQVTLTKVKPGEWKVNDRYIARNDVIHLLLKTIKSIEVKSPVGKKAQETVIKNLASDAIKIEVYQNDHLTKMYYIGGQTPDQLGTYMLLANTETGVNSSVPFVMYIPGFDGYLTPRYITKEQDWRDRNIFNYSSGELKSVKIEFTPAPDSSYEISVNGNNQFNIRLVKSNKPLYAFDTLAVKQYLSYYQSINFETFANVNKATKDSIVSSSPRCVITATDTKGTQNMVKIYAKPAPQGAVDINDKPLKYDIDRMYALINHGEDLVTIQYYVFGKLFEPVTYFTGKHTVKK